MVEFQRMGDVGSVDGGHRIPLYTVLAQQLDSTNDALPRGLAAGSEPIMVVKGLRTVDGEAHEEMVCGEELAPLVVEQRSVGLQSVGNLPPSSIASLQFYGLPVEVQGPKRGFASVPSEKHLGHRLRLDIFFGESLEEVFGHDRVPLASLVGRRPTDVSRRQIITILASQIAPRPYGLEHHIERSGKRRYGFHDIGWWVLGVGWWVVGVGC